MEKFLGIFPTVRGTARMFVLSFLILIAVLVAVLIANWPKPPPLPQYELNMQGNDDHLGERETKPPR